MAGSPIYTGPVITGTSSSSIPGKVQTPTSNAVAAQDPNTVQVPVGSVDPAFSKSSSSTSGSSTTTPTVVTDANIRENAIPQIQQGATKALSTPQTPVVPPTTTPATPTVTPGAGSTTPPPATSTPGAGSGSGSGTGTSTDGSDSDSSNNEYDDFLKSMFDSNPSTGTQGVAPANDPYITMLQNMQATSDAGTASLIAATQTQFENRKATLAATQASQHAGLMQELVSNGESKYAPLLAGQSMTSDEQSHILALSDIDSQESTALATLQKAQDDEDFQTMGKELDHLDSLREDKITEAGKLADAATAATTALNNAKATVTSGINSVAEEAAKNGADPATLAAITAAPDVGSAINAAGDSLQTGTGDTALYLQYSRDAKSSGQIPESYNTWENAQNYNKAYSSAEGDAAGKAAAAATYSGTEDTSPVQAPNGATYNPPASIAPYVGFATNGAKYVDLSSFAGTPTEKNEAVQDAESSGYKVITNKNTALDLVNITNAKSNLQSMKDAFDPNSADNAAARDTYKAQLNNLSSFLQTNPDEAAIGTFNDTALDILKAVSGVQGFRGGASAIEQVRETLPQITDTKAVVDQKISNIETLINNRESAIVGKPSASDALIDQNAKAQSSVNDYVKTNPDQAASIAKLYNVPGATDAQVYQYLLQSGKIQTNETNAFNDLGDMDNDNEDDEDDDQ